MAAFDLSQLNPQQREAVRQIEGPVLILAGAGTGKTRTITARMAHMIRQGIQPEGICGVTFTNKAAAEMRERVGGMVAREDARQLTLCTFHSLCVRLLRQDIDSLGWKRNFSIYTQSDQVGLLRKLIVRKGGKDEKLEARELLSQISRAKNEGLSPKGVLDPLLALVYEAYQSELKLQNALDFDDLLLKAVQLLEKEKKVRKKWQERFTHLMVDEFQDTNQLQMRLVTLLVGKPQNLCVVGDDDQSIYGWRGADLRNILEFERHFKRPTVLKLEENYRSTNPILETANSLIRHNVGRREKRLWSRKAGAERIRVISMPGDEAESEFLITEIFETRHSEARKWEDFAILFRTNQQSRLFEQQLRQLDIPYRVVGGMSFFDRREVRDVLAFLQLLENPEDDVNLLRVLNTPPRGLSAKIQGAALEESRLEGKSVVTVLLDESFQRSLSTRAQSAIEEFFGFLQRYRDRLVEDATTYPEVAGEMLTEMAYLEWMKRQCKTDSEKDSRERSVHEMLNSLVEHRNRRRGGLRAYLDDMALQGEKDEDGDLSKKQGVCLITLHAAKGLEFPIVYLAGLEEGILPHRRSMEEGTREEERRLLYVGITRAMERLTLTYCSTRVRYGQKMSCLPSSFFKEIDPAHLDELRHDEIAAKPASEETKKGLFDDWKGMLEGIDGVEVD
ncbi:MAG: UvrD-helicase domain-containing protein [Verrucomicrobiota bacterium]